MDSICEKCNHKNICGFQDDETLACSHFQKEVVRCKDCKHWQESVDGITKWCPLLMDKETKENDFCSYGERKDNE